LEERLGEKRELPPSIASSPATPSITTVANVVRHASPSAEASPSPSEEEAGASWPDEAAESSFLSDARERGEPVVVAKANVESAEETDAKPLPPLNELVERIPAEVREALDDLFRARFVTVKRVPKRALKS
jgi:hypothetical protein